MESRLKRNARLRSADRAVRPSAAGRHMGLTAMIALFSSCSLLSDPWDGPSVTLERFPAFPEYEVWWEELQACSGRRGDLSKIRFFLAVAPLSASGRQFVCGRNGQECAGEWVAPHDVYLAPGFVTSERIVKHEMLHDLIRDGSHPRVFLRCAA